MSNKGKRETNKQITEVKQELQKELDKMGRVHSNIPIQQVEESGATTRKSMVQPSENKSLTSEKIPSTIVDNDKAKRKQPTQQKSKSKSSKTNKVSSKITGGEKENKKGRPKGAKDKQPRKKRNLIEEAQQKLEQRREELNNIPETDKEVIERINEQDEITKEILKKDKQFEYAFYQGEIIENRIYDMCARASQYKWTSSTNRMWVKGILQESKAKYGELNFYNRLWNMEGETLDNCEKIIWESEGQVGSEEDREAKNRIANILLNIPVNELEVED